jgi:uncharacterized protein involved in outer membrane biogenesis
MKKLIKIIAFLISALILLFLLAVITLTFFINPNDLKVPISRWVYQHTSQQIAFNGPIEWSFFPQLGLKLNNVQLNGQAKAGNQPIITLNQAIIRAELWPLLRKQLQVSSIDVTGGQIKWQNQPGSINQLQLHSSDIHLGQPFPLQMQFVVMNSATGMTGNIKFTGTVTLQQNGKQVLIDPLEINSALQGPTFPNKQLNLDVTGNAVFNSNTQSLQAQLQSDQLHLGNITLTKPAIHVNANAKQIVLSPITADLYQGFYAGKMIINTATKTLRINSTNQLVHIQLAPLLQAMAPKSALQLSGIGNINAQVTTYGTSTNALLQHLNGRGRFSVTNGILHGINIPYWVNTARSFINKQLPNSLAPDANQTEFGDLTSDFTLTNGVMQNPNILLQAPLFVVKGQGSANFVNQQLNYALKAQLLNPSTHQPQGDIVPLEVGGTFSHPVVQPVAQQIIKSQLQDQYNQHKEKIGQQLEKFLGKDTGQQVQNQLQKFFQQ